MAKGFSEKRTNKGRNDSNFSLRQYQLNQVQRDYLNSLQNTPKAKAKVGILINYL